MVSRLDLVKEFHDKFDANLPHETRLTVIREEIREFAEAYQHMLKEAADLQYVLVGGMVDGHYKDIPVEQVPELLDVIPLMMMLPQDILDEAFIRVHESNMSKLGEDGKPIKRDDGKILKGPNYFEPDLSDLILVD